jgi:RNA polymerase II subunit A C-terminal domain phosphatase
MSDFSSLSSRHQINVPTDDFFVGIGDINSAFLPRLDPSTSAISQMSSTPPGKPPAVSGPALSISAPGPVPNDPQSSTVGPSSADEAVAEENLQKEMIARNSLALEAQVEERPLAKLQEELQEAANGQLTSDSPTTDTASGQNESTPNPPEALGEKHHRKALLKNDDTELRRIKRVSCPFLLKYIDI